MISFSKKYRIILGISSKRSTAVIDAVVQKIKLYKTNTFWDSSRNYFENSSRNPWKFLQNFSGNYLGCFMSNYHKNSLKTIQGTLEESVTNSWKNFRMNSWRNILSEFSHGRIPNRSPGEIHTDASLGLCKYCRNSHRCPWRNFQWNS